MARTNQGGSILGFVLIGGVLALLLVGGAYLVRKNTALPADTGAAPETAQTEKKPEKTEEKPQSAPKKEDKQTNNNAQKEPEAIPGAGADELPKTGPAQTVLTIVMLGILVAVSVSYVQSRRLTSSL